MIGCFPTPFPDELLYSICARYSDRVQYPGRETVLRELFSTDSTLVTSLFPSQLEYLVAHLPAGHHYTADWLIDHHTLLPAFSPFLAPERVQAIRKAMYSHNGQIIHKLGIAHSSLHSSTSLSLCPKCVRQDRQRFGECYWHRVHQVPGVVVCPKHQTELIDGLSFGTYRSHLTEFISAERFMETAQLRPKTVMPPEPFLQVARDVSWLFKRKPIMIEPLSLQNRYQIALKERGFLGPMQKLRLKSLLDDFNYYYSDVVLKRFHCPAERDSDKAWIGHLLKANVQAHHPIQHLLLIHFLGHSLASFLQMPLSEKPFGEGPWPCLNPASTHYLAPLILEYQLKTNRSDIGQELRALFACSCGFVYSRCGPDRSPEDRFCLSRIECFGPEWESELCRLWEDPAYNRNQVARRLGISHPVLKRRVRLLGLPPDPPGKKIMPSAESMQKRWDLLCRELAGISLVKSREEADSFLSSH